MSAENTTMIRVVIADDHPLFLKGLKTVLADAPDLQVVGEANDGEQLVRLTQDLAPDVILLDIKMPKMNGLDAFQKLCTAGKKPAALFLTMHDSPEFLQRSLELGANGYLLKDTDPDELLAAIRAVAQGETVVSPQVATDLLERQAKRKGAPEDALTLNSVDRQVLRLLAEGLTSAEIDEKLHLSRRTIETYRQRLMQKFGVGNAVALFKKALDLGLLK